MSEAPVHSTDLFAVPGNGSEGGVNELFPMVYAELRAIAARVLAREGRGHTLAPTALVHEAYMKLMGQRSAGWETKAQFLGVAAQAMRRILTDYARMKRAAKRSGAARSTATDRILVEWEANALDLVALDDALCELAAMDARKARVIELRFFAGLTAQQAADLLETPLRTVNRDWAAARAWLYARLQDR